MATAFIPAFFGDFEVNLPIFIHIHTGFIFIISLTTLLTRYKPLPPSIITHSHAGIPTLAIALAYYFTSYMPVSQNQFLYASVPVRLILAFVAAARALLIIDGSTPGGKLERVFLWQIVALDGVGGLFLGWWLSDFSGRLPGWSGI